MTDPGPCARSGGDPGGSRQTVETVGPDRRDGRRESTGGSLMCPGGHSTDVLGDWVRSWRATYEEYPVATVVTLSEIGLAGLLLPAAFAYAALAGDLPDWVGLAVVAVGTAFAAWFTVLRRPVLDRLVAD